METANNPNSRGTDNNGVEDGEEDSGTISSFDWNSGMLGVDFGNGHTASGLVTSATRIECRAREEQEAENENENENEANDARAADHGGSDDGDRSASDNSGPGSNNSGPGDGNDEGTTCGTADLTRGTVVHEAELQDENGG